MVSFLPQRGPVPTDSSDRLECARRSAGCVQMCGVFLFLWTPAEVFLKGQTETHRRFNHVARASANGPPRAVFREVTGTDWCWLLVSRL